MGGRECECVGSFVFKAVIVHHWADMIDAVDAVLSTSSAENTAARSAGARVHLLPTYNGLGSNSADDGVGGVLGECDTIAQRMAAGGCSGSAPPSDRDAAREEEERGKAACRPLESGFDPERDREELAAVIISQISPQV